MSFLYAFLRTTGTHIRFVPAKNSLLFAHFFSLLLMLAIPAAQAEEPQFLDPEKAFAMTARAAGSDQVEVRFDIAEGYYLYQDKLKFSASTGAVAGTPVLPQPLLKHDQFQNREKAIYRQQLVFNLPVQHQGQPFTLTVSAQGCADAGLCYPPFRQSAQLTLPAAGTPVALASAAAAPSVAPSAASTGQPAIVDESGRVNALLGGGNIALTLASFFGFGLLLALTPCVFPMIPILSGIIVGHGSHISKRRAFSLSLTYVLGMAVTYTLAGVAAGLSGTLLSNALQNVWVLSGFALVFVVLSLSMFDVYQLQLPAGVQGRLSQTANNQGGSVTGVALMGALSALIVGPCVAAPLAGALLYIAQTGDALLGGAALFCLALGMGAPLLAVGVAARSLLPKAGAWMENVKKLFGVMLLAVAIWIVSPVASPLFIMLAIATLALFCGIFLHALDPLPVQAGARQRLGKGIGVIAVTVGLALLVGVLAGSRDPLQPLAFLRATAYADGGSGAVVANQPTAFTRVLSTQDLDTTVASAQQPVLLDFYADWCVSCKEMEHLTFSDPAVRKHLEKLTLVQADVTANGDSDKALLQRFGLFGPPAVILLDGAGNEITRVIGFQDAETFTQTLENALQRTDNQI